MAPELDSLTVSIGRRGLGLLGLGSVAIVLVGALIAAVPYRGYAGESYSPLNHFISELGEIGASRFAFAFNLGLVAGGLGLAAFLLAVSRTMDGPLRRIFVVVSLLAGGAGPMCGLYPMDYLQTHRIVSVAFFLSGWALAGTFTLWQLRARSTAWPRWLVVPGLGAVVLFAAFIAVYASYHPAAPDAKLLSRSDVWTVPLLEWAALLSLLVWIACLAIAVLRRPTTHRPTPH